MPNEHPRDGISRRSVLEGTAAVGGAGLVGFGGSELAAAGGRTTLIIRADELDTDALTRDADVVDELKSTAQTTQRPIVEYLQDREGIRIRNRFWITNALLIEVDTSKVSVGEVAATPGVRHVHENFTLELPEPAAGPEQSDGEPVTTYGLEQIDAPTAREQFGTNGEGADIAVVDTGVDPEHPDIDIQDQNFVEFDSDGNEIENAETRDSSYHGTHVSGVVTGGDAFVNDADENVEIGVAPGATLYHALSLPDGGGTFAQVIAGIQWAVDRGVDVVNLSLGARGFQPDVIEPVRNAVEAGVVVVASSGNDGPGTVSSPGAVFEATAVGATDETRTVTDFSSGATIDTDEDWGADAPDTWPEEYLIPDLSGPGSEVLSAFPRDAAPPPGLEPIDEQWIELSGTSFSAPHVAGTVGLMQSAAQSVPEEYDPGQVSTALTTTATKPDDAPEQDDTRYGAGIVDAVAATARFAADSGVVGTVTDEDGTVITDATVSLEGFPTQTDDAGEYRLRSKAGTFEVTAEGFGFTTQTTTVDVEDGFTVQDFELSDTLGIRLLDGQPSGLRAEESFEVELEAANLEKYRVEITEESTLTPDDLTLSLNGDEISLDDPVNFQEPLSDEVTLTVDPATDAFGSVGLKHTLSGLGRTTEVQTGPTDVFDEFIEIAVVDRENGAFTDDLVGLLDNGLEPIYDITTVTPAEALSAAQAGDPDAFVVHSLGEDEDLVQEFVSATSIPQIGTVYLHQTGGTGAAGEDGQAADAIYQLSEATGDPREVVDTAVQEANPPVRYSVRDEEHPIIEDAGVEGLVTLYRPFPIQFFGGFHSFFREFEGDVTARTIADIGPGLVNDGEPGLASDDLTRTVLAASLGLSVFVSRRVFFDEAVTLLAASTRFVADSPPVTVLEDQPDRIDSGGSTELRLSVGDLLEYEVTLSEDSTLTAEDLTLSLNGERIAFGESVEFEEPLTGEITLAVDADDAVGRFALDHRFVTLGDFNEEETTEALTGPTSVYTPPLSVPGDISPINAAVDLAIEGAEIVVADGVYEETAPNAASAQAGLSVDTRGLTIRAAEDATPSVVHAEDLPAPRVVDVTADNVSISGLEANVIDGDIDEKNSIGTGIRVDADGVTVREVTVGGTFGVQLEGDIANLAVEDVTAVSTITAVGNDLGAFGDQTDIEIRDVTVTDRPEFGFTGTIKVDAGATRVTVTDCEIDLLDGENGIVLGGPFDGGEDCRIANNRIVGDDLEAETDFTVANAGILVNQVGTVVEDNETHGTGIGVHGGDRLGFGERPVEVLNNSLTGAEIGYRQTGEYVSFTGNVVEAETGIDLGDGEFFGGIEANQFLAQYNDLSATDVPFTGTPYESFFEPVTPLVFDCRRNYVGDRTYDDSIVDGDIAYNPFLTAPPDEVDRSAPTQIAVDLYFNPGEEYGFGVPGPTDKNVFETLRIDRREFDGELQFWSSLAEQWIDVGPQGFNARVDPLDTYRVVPPANDGIRAVVDFSFDERTRDVGGGPLGQVDVRARVNALAAPEYGDDVSVFETGTAEVSDVTTDLQGPARELPVETFSYEAFSVNFVDVAAAGTINASLDQYDPTVETLYDSLGLDISIHESPGAPAAPALDANDTETLPSVAEVVSELQAAGVDDQTIADEVTELLGRLVAAAVATADADASVVDTVSQTIETQTEGVSANGAVETASVRALQAALDLAPSEADTAPERTVETLRERYNSTSRLRGTVASWFSSER